MLEVLSTSLVKRTRLLPQDSPTQATHVLHSVSVSLGRQEHDVRCTDRSPATKGCMAQQDFVIIVQRHTSHVKYIISSIFKCAIQWYYCTTAQPPLFQNFLITQIFNLSLKIFLWQSMHTIKLAMMRHEPFMHITITSQRVSPSYAETLLALNDNPTPDPRPLVTPSCFLSIRM